MVVLRVWNSAKRGGAGWGHSSLEIGGTPPAGVYISWWPGNENKTVVNPPDFAESKTFEQDKNLEGPPSFTFNFSGLNERAMKVWWMKWRESSLIYSAAGKNCSSTVAKALEAGGAERLAKLAGWQSSILPWTPARLADYARSIQAGLTKR